MKNTQINQIKQDLINGVQFGNDLANWCSVVNVNENRFIIIIREDMKFYKNLNSVSKRINKLINTGL